MEKPKPIVIALTPEQAAALQSHFEFVHHEHERGSTGILAAQVFGPGTCAIGAKGNDLLFMQADPSPARIRVGFIDNELASQIVATAK